MNQNFGNPLLLLVSLLVSLFVHTASASPAQSPGYYQPGFLPPSASGYAFNYAPRYRFRPITKRLVSNPYRPPVVAGFSRYYGAPPMALYAYPPGFRPAGFYRPHNGDRTPRKTVGYQFPRSFHYPASQFRYLAGAPQWDWRGPPVPATDLAFNQRRTAGFTRPWAGVQPSYYGQFRPLRAYPAAPSRLLAANWGRPMQWRPYPTQPRFVERRADRASLTLANSAPGYIEAQRDVMDWRYPSSQRVGYVSADKQQAVARNRIHFSNGNYRQAGRSMPASKPYFVPFPTLNPDYTVAIQRHPFKGFRRLPKPTAKLLPAESGNRRGFHNRHYQAARDRDYPRNQRRYYRFRPESRTADNRQEIRTPGKGYWFPEGTAYSLSPSSSADYRFRPDARFGRKFPAAPRQQPSIPEQSSEAVMVNHTADDYGRFSINGIRSLGFDLIDPLDAVDLSEIPQHETLTNSLNPALSL